MTTHPVDSPSREGFVHLSASSSSFCARAVLGTLIAFLALAGPAMGCNTERPGAPRRSLPGVVKCAGGGGGVSAGVSVVKSASATSYTAPETPITYSYLIKNTGNVDLTVSVTDPHVGLSAISCPSSTLAASASETCTAIYTTTQADVDAGSISNTGTVTGTNAEYDATVSALSSLTISTVGTAALTLTKSASASSYSAPGTGITYSYLVTNTGGVELTGVSVTDPQLGLSAVSCPNGTLAAGASETCTATYTTSQADVDAGSISNTGTASGTPPTGPAVTATALLTILAVDAPAVSVVKSANVTLYSAPGVVITYSYLVTNTGNVTLTDVSVTDPQLGLSEVTCPSGMLSPSVSETCTATYTTTLADVDAGSISNTGTAGGTAPDNSTVAAMSSLTIPASDAPAISVVKTANVVNYSAPGISITYSYKVTNTGNEDLNPVSVTDPQLGLSTVTCPNTSLAPAASETCTASYTTTQADVDAGSISNTGMASGTPQTGSAATATSTLTIPAVDTPAISLAKTANVTSYSAPGIVITYSYKVTNAGNVTMNPVSVTDPHVGLSAISCGSTSLAPGASETCTATYTTTQADVNAGSISNTGTASGKPPTGPVVTITSSLTIPATASPALTVMKSVTSTGPYNAVGQSITYSFVAKNTGNVTLSSVGIADTQTAPAGALTSGPTCQSLSSPVGSCSGSTTSLVAGQSATFTASYTITQADLNHGSVNDSATASGTPPTGSPVASPISTATVTTTSAPALTVMKSVTSTGPYNAAGQSITYSFVAKNTGNVTLSSVGIADTQTAPAGALTSGPTCQSLSSPVGSCSGSTTSLVAGQSATFTASYTITQADLNHGSVNDSATASGTPPTGSPVASPTSTATVTTTSAPALTVMKTANVANYSAPGVVITYSYKVTNSGNVDLTAVSVTDPHVGLSPINCPSTSLAPGAFETCTATYTTTQGDLDAGSISNTGTARGTPPTGPAVTATSSVTIPAVDAPALTLVKTASVTSYSAAGTAITYYYQVTNTGNVDLTVSVTDPHVGLSTITCATNPLMPGIAETCTATYTTTQADLDAGSISNTGTASGTPLIGPVVTATSSLTISASKPALSLVKTANVMKYSAPGTLITYSYLVTNTGNVSLTVSVTDPQIGLSTISCPSASLAPGAFETCTATYSTMQTDVDAGSISNTGTASGTPPTGPAVTATSSLTISASDTPALGLVKIASATSYSAPGTLITYFYLVTNTGNVDLSAVSVTDPQPGLSAVNCPSGTLAPAASETCTATYITAQSDVDAGSISNTGTASGTPLTGPVVTATFSLTIRASDTPSLSLVKSASVMTYSASGTVITYSYLVTNTGNEDLTAVSVTDPQLGLNGVSCPSTSLAPGVSQTCTAPYTITQADLDAGSITNTGTASGKPQTGSAVTATSSLTITASDAPSVSVVKTASVTNYSAPGTPITYSYLVTNTGNVDLSAVSVTDPQMSLSAISCPSATLAPAASETCTATYTTTQADVDAGLIINTGTASGTFQTGPAVTATSTLTIPAIDTPALTLVKSAGVTIYAASGTPITYFFFITNSGNVTLTALSITDPHVGLSAISCPYSFLAPGISEICTATYTTTPADITAGSITNTASASGKGPSGGSVASLPSSITIHTGTVTVTVSTSTSGPTISVDGGLSFTGTQNFTWIIGSPHTLATNSPQTPTAGTQYTFASWSDGGASSHSVTASTGTISYNASFNTSYLLTTAVGSGGGGTVSPATGSYYPAGAPVPLVATPANTGYTFANWTGPVASASSASTTVTMSGPENVTANFVVNNVGVTINTSPSGLAVSVDGGAPQATPVPVTWQVGTPHTIATTSPQTLSAGTQYTFASWSDSGALSHSVTASAATTSYTASFNTSYLLTTAAGPAGSGTVSPASGSYYPGGTPVPLVATPANTGYKFANWTGSPVASASSASTTVTMSGPESVTANFVVNNVGVTINTSPSGLAVSVDGGAPQASPVPVTWQVGTPHTIATTSPQTLSAGTQYTFASWSDSGALSHSVTASAGTTSYNASFNTSYLLTTAVSPGGAGTVSPVSGSYYPAGTPVPLVATAATGYKFANWTGSPVASANSASTNVTMSGPETVTANFVVNNVGVTINTSPSGLAVSVDGAAPQATPVAVTWQVGSPHTIATTSPQTPTAGTRYTFASWSDAGAISHSVTASAATTSYTASFNTSYLLTTGVSPSGGGTVTPVSGSYYAAGTPVPLVATASAGYIFSSWTGPVAGATSASTNVTMSAPESVTANFISALTISPSSSYNFGTVYLGSITTENFTLANIGTTPISVSGPFISIVKGGDSNEFVEVDECPKSLAGGSHCTISVTFIAGPFFTPQTATLSITDNAPGSPQTVTLTATVIDPVPSFNPTSLSFGNQTVNTSVTKTVTLKNVGATALSLTGMTVKGTNAAEFTLTPASNCGSSLTAGNSCTISVTFKPLAKVSYAATLNVTDNAQQSTQVVTLSGTGH